MSWHDHTDNTIPQIPTSEINNFYIIFRFHEAADSDNEDWKEHEASRTHSVKFSEDSYTIDKDTPFVRQNTPHPKDLKAKAHKLFAKEKAREEGNLDPLSEEVN